MNRPLSSFFCLTSTEMVYCSPGTSSKARPGEFQVEVRKSASRPSAVTRTEQPRPTQPSVLTEKSDW